MMAEDFSHASEFVGETNLDYQRRFYKCEDWTDEDLDEFVKILRHYPGGEWVDGFGTDVTRVYAMSCIRLREDNRAAFERQIVEGMAWLSFGHQEPEIYRRDES